METKQDKKNKRTIKIGTLGTLSSEVKDFFSERFIVKEISFERMLESGKSANLIFYGGGPDVGPKLYGEVVGKYTKSDKKRDDIFSKVFENWYHTPKLGFCGGAQFLTAASGGKLIQHVEGHNKGEHFINVHFEGNSRPSKFKMTSTHHQMMYPFNLEDSRYRLLGWASKFQSLVYLDGSNKQKSLPNKFVEPEIVYYPNSRSLAIQGHPEHLDCNEQTKELCLNLIEDYLY